MIEEIQNKVDILIRNTSTFREHEVVYIIVESYKIAERKWRHDYKRKIPYIVFFRNWVAHTELDRKIDLSIDKIKRESNLITDKLKEEILTILEKNESKVKLKELWDSFHTSLLKVLANQPILLTQKLEIIEYPEQSGQFIVKIL